MKPVPRAVVLVALLAALATLAACAKGEPDPGSAAPAEVDDE